MRRGMVLVLLCLVIGCGRAWYRRDADRETYAALEERNYDPQWHVPYFSLNPNPASRLYDPYDPDYPPMPPDDPAAYQYMLRVNGMRNYRRWHKDGDAPSVENPEWRNYLPLDDKGVLVLSRERAVELAWLAVRREHWSSGVGTRLVIDSLAQLPSHYEVCQVKTMLISESMRPIQLSSAVLNRTPWVPSFSSSGAVGAPMPITEPSLGATP